MMIKLLLTLLILLITLQPYPCFGATRNPFLPKMPVEIIKLKPVVEKKSIPSVKQNTVKTQPKPNIPKANTQTSVPAQQIPKPAEPVVFPNFKVTGVIWDSDKRQAIMNNNVVTEGDVIEGVTIKSISKTAITLFYQGVEQIIAP